jgi:hypothetical protein
MRFLTYIANIGEVEGEKMSKVDPIYNHEDKYG